MQRACWMSERTRFLVQSFHLDCSIMRLRDSFSNRMPYFILIYLYFTGVWACVSVCVCARLIRVFLLFCFFLFRSICSVGNAPQCTDGCICCTHRDREYRAYALSGENDFLILFKQNTNTHSHTITTNTFSYFISLWTQRKCPNPKPSIAAAPTMNRLNGKISQRSGKRTNEKNGEKNEDDGSWCVESKRMDDGMEKEWKHSPLAILVCGVSRGHRFRCNQALLCDC